jgi:hypothetical protein
VVWAVEVPEPTVSVSFRSRLSYVEVVIVATSGEEA